LNSSPPAAIAAFDPRLVGRPHEGTDYQVLDARRFVDLGDRQGDAAFVLRAE
jgi:hypothetical protein